MRQESCPVTETYRAQADRSASARLEAGFVENTQNHLLWPRWKTYWTATHARGLGSSASFARARCPLRALERGVTWLRCCAHGLRNSGNCSAQTASHLELTPSDPVQATPRRHATAAKRTLVLDGEQAHFGPSTELGALSSSLSAPGNRAARQGKRCCNLHSTILQRDAGAVSAANGEALDARNGAQVEVAPLRRPIRARQRQDTYHLRYAD